MSVVEVSPLLVRVTLAMISRTIEEQRLLQQKSSYYMGAAMLAPLAAFG